MNPNEHSKSAQSMRGTTSPPHEGGTTSAPANSVKFLRLPAVEERTGLKKSTLYAQVKTGKLASPVRLSARAVAWREEDIDRWCADRVPANLGANHAKV